MKRTKFFAAAILALSITQVGGAMAQLAVPSKLVDNGIALNGHHFNGIVINGIVINGTFFNGASRDETLTNPFAGLDRTPLGR